MIELSSLVSVLLTLIVGGIVVWLLWWLLDYCGLPEPFNKVGHVIIAVVAVFFVISVLMGLVGHPIVRWG